MGLNDKDPTCAIAVSHGFQRDLGELFMVGMAARRRPCKRPDHVRLDQPPFDDKAFWSEFVPILARAGE